jgi:apolipoprotein N-acyltransferase
MFGFGYFISNLYWITNSLTFEEIFKPLIPFALILIPLFLGIFYGIAIFACSLFNLKKNFSSILIFSIFLSLIEYVRSFIFGGFPWNLIAYSWTDYLNFLQIVSFTGTYLFNFFSIIFFLIPAIIFFKYKKKTKLFSLAIAIAILTINFIYGAITIKNNKKIDETNLNFIIKIISPKIEINRFFQNENPKKTILDLVKLSKPNDLKKTIFIFPEGVLSNIYLQDLKNYSYIFSENYSDKHKIILGISSNEESYIYNSLVVLDKDANILAKYDKNKLVPFGEFLPYENLLSKFGLKKITQGYLSFSASNKRNIININNIKFLPLICYEIIYSGQLNKSKEDYDFIINISEDGWFGNSVGPYQHFSHSIFRAIEEGKNIIRSSNNGISAYIDPTGQIINSIESTQKGVIEFNNFKKHKKTYFSTHGINLYFYFILFFIALILFLKRNR